MELAGGTVEPGESIAQAALREAHDETGLEVRLTRLAAGVRRATRLLLSAAFAVPILLGATISYFALRGQPELYKLMLLTFTAGVLTTLVVEELVPEAHEEAADIRLAPLVFAAGFALFALISAYFEIE